MSHVSAATSIRSRMRCLVFTAGALSMLNAAQPVRAERVRNVDSEQVTQQTERVAPRTGRPIGPATIQSAQGGTGPGTNRGDEAATISETMAPPPVGDFAYSDLTVRATGTAPRLCAFGYCVESTIFRPTDVHITVQNIGSGPSGATQVMVWMIGNGLTESQEVWRHAIPGLQPGATVRIDAPGLDCGGNGLQVIVDPDRRVSESNERNNVFGFAC